METTNVFSGAEFTEVFDTRDWYIVNALVKFIEHPEYNANIIEAHPNYQDLIEYLKEAYVGLLEQYGNKYYTLPQHLKPIIDSNDEFAKKYPDIMKIAKKINAKIDNYFFKNCHVEYKYEEGESLQYFHPIYAIYKYIEHPDFNIDKIDQHPLYNELIEYFQAANEYKPIDLLVDFQDVLDFNKFQNRVLPNLEVRQTVVNFFHNLLTK